MEPEDLTLASIAAAHNGVFTLECAALAGLTQKEIEYRSQFVWERLHAGVYRFPGAPETWAGTARAAVWAGEPNAVLSHRSAAVVYNLPGARKDLVELSCPRWRRTQTNGLVVHESTFIHPNDVQLVDDVPVVRPERAVFELASIYRSPDFVERVLHAARRQKLITYPSTVATFNRLAGRGRRGTVVFREALERWVPSQRPTESEMETLLLQMLRKRGFPAPVLQYEVYDAVGRFVGRVDAALLDYRVLIEYQSVQEHVDEWSVRRDDARRNKFVALGYKPLMAWHEDLKSGGRRLAGEIRDCIRRSA